MFRVLLQNEWKGAGHRSEGNAEGEFGNALLTWFTEVRLHQRSVKLGGGGLRVQTEVSDSVSAFRGLDMIGEGQEGRR